MWVWVGACVGGSGSGCVGVGVCVCVCGCGWVGRFLCCLDLRGTGPPGAPTRSRATGEPPKAPSHVRSIDGASTGRCGASNSILWMDEIHSHHLKPWLKTFQWSPRPHYLRQVGAQKPGLLTWCEIGFCNHPRVGVLLIGCLVGDGFHWFRLVLWPSSYFEGNLCSTGLQLGHSTHRTARPPQTRPQVRYVFVFAEGPDVFGVHSKRVVRTHLHEVPAVIASRKGPLLGRQPTYFAYNHAHIADESHSSCNQKLVIQVCIREHLHVNGQDQEAGKPGKPNFCSKPISALSSKVALYLRLTS